MTVHAVATGSATLSWTSADHEHRRLAADESRRLQDLLGQLRPIAYPNSVTLDNPGLTRYVVTDLVPGTWFFVATALNGIGAESGFSSSERRPSHIIHVSRRAKRARRRRSSMARWRFAQPACL